MTNNYEIGYCKPPQGTRFKAGKSGNGKGRPKGRKKEDIIDLLNKELKSKLTLKDGNKITKETAMVRQLCNKASSGDFKSGKLILDVATRQQISILASEFLEKLIREKYVTEKNVKNYIRNGKLLELEEMPRALYELYKGVDISHARAWMAIMSVLRLMYIWQNFYAVIKTKNILNAINTEEAFWEGFDMSLNSMQIDEEKRKELISQAEAGRDYKRPDKALSRIALNLDMFMTGATLEMFIKMREVYKAVEGYEEAKEKWFSRGHIEYMFDEIETEKICDYDELRRSMKEQEAEFADFSKFSFRTKEIGNLRAKIKKEDVAALFAWYDTVPEKWK